MTDLRDALAVYRLWRLAAKDTVLDGPRSRFEKWAWSRNDGKAIPWPLELLWCPWCLGFWLALAALACRRVFPRVWALSADALALSAAAGIVAEIEERLART